MINRLGKWKLLFLLFLIAGSIYVVLSDRKSSRYITDEGFVFGTTYRITYSYPHSLRTDIEERLALVDASLSPFNDRSIISAVNANRPVEVDTMFASVFELAATVSEQTGGAFDITVAPLVNAWGFGFRNSSGVSPADIDSLRRIVGFRKVRLDSTRRVVKADPRIMLDCSAIAKGYGCDEVARLFDSRGITNYMIEIGGEIVVKGNARDHEAWDIGISKPDEDSVNVNSGLQAVLNLTGCAVATSGNYRRFYYKNGQRFSHTIDPRTGYPVNHTLLSSTVVASNCVMADAFATAFMVLGVDSARAVLRQHPDLQAMFVYSSESGVNRVWMSPGLEHKIKASAKNNP